MIIEWFGKTCVRLSTADAMIVVDPFRSTSELKSPRLTADLLLLSDDATERSAVSGAPFIIDQPGEYEVKKAFVYGIPAQNEQQARRTIFLIEVEGISCAHLGNLGHQLTNGELERLEGVDILFIPVGGHAVLNAEQAAEVISAVEPRVVIPMQYKIPGLKDNLDSVSKFAKELGVKESETLEKFRVSRKDLPQDDMKVVILHP